MPRSSSSPESWYPLAAIEFMIARDVENISGADQLPPSPLDTLGAGRDVAYQGERINVKQGRGLFELPALLTWSNKC